MAHSNIRKILAGIFILFVSLCICLIACGEIVNSGTCGENVTWTLDDEGLMTITGTGKTDNYNSSTQMPWNTDKVKTVVIDFGITGIGSSFFQNCTGLTGITFPESLTMVETMAFKNCSSLTSVSFPKFTRIADYAFMDCTSLTNVALPENLTLFSNGVFKGCTSLTSLVLPPNLQTISIDSFDGCTGLTDLTISSYFNCQWYEILIKCPNLANLTITGNATRIEDYNFRFCKMTNVTLGESLTSIGDRAFEKCENLRSITIPDNVTRIGKYAFQDCSSMTNAVIGNGITCLEDGLFGGCKGMTSITIPNTVTSIGAGAFNGCSSLPEIRIPDGVTSISNHLFHGCGLTSISIPERITSIGEEAFFGCLKLTEITIPAGITEIGKRAFRNCFALKTATVSTYMQDIDIVDIFEGCSDLERIILPDDHPVLSTYDGTVIDRKKKSLIFCPRGKTGSLTIPDSVVQIEKSAFYFCEKLSAVVIPDSVTELIYEQFYCCSSLESITIPGSVKTLGSIFYQCGKLKDVTIKNGMTTIGSSAFCSCSSLARITIPKSITDIGSSAFYLCTGMKTVYYGGTREDREKINIDQGNKPLLDASWHYNTVLPDSDPEAVNIAGAEISAVKDRVYTGKKITPSVTVKYNGKKLKAGTDYTLFYRNNKNIGTATVVVKGKGKYTGTAETTFKIVPKAVQLTSLTPGKNILTVQWKKGSGITGYEIQYSTSSKFTNAKTVTIRKAGQTSTEIKKLTRGRTYYVRIRAYKTVKGIPYSSAWSKAKKATVK